MNEELKLQNEIIHEALDYINRLKKNFMQIEMEYYWHNTDEALSLLNDLNKGLIWLKGCYSAIIKGKEIDLLSEDFVEAQRIEIEFLTAIDSHDWFTILDFLRFKFKSYLIYLEAAYLKLKY